eukprot:m.61420 g.61420  ORF g.61420 m.61420 type:complete len:387 (-) comp13721_c0_seq1:511-1671(-)
MSAKFYSWHSMKNQYSCQVPFFHMSHNHSFTHTHSHTQLHPLIHTHSHTHTQTTHTHTHSMAANEASFSTANTSNYDDLRRHNAGLRSVVEQKDMDLNRLREELQAKADELRRQTDELRRMREEQAQLHKGLKIKDDELCKARKMLWLTWFVVCVLTALTIASWQKADECSIRFNNELDRAAAQGSVVRAQMSKLGNEKEDFQKTAAELQMLLKNREAELLRYKDALEACNSAPFCPFKDAINCATCHRSSSVTSYSGKLGIGSVVSFQYRPTSSDFIAALDLNCGDEILLHFNPRGSQNSLVLNSEFAKRWGPEERHSSFPLAAETTTVHIWFGPTGFLIQANSAARPQSLPFVCLYNYRSNKIVDNIAANLPNMEFLIVRPPSA